MHYRTIPLLSARMLGSGRFPKKKLFKRMHLWIVDVLLFRCIPKDGMRGVACSLASECWVGGAELLENVFKFGVFKHSVPLFEFAHSEANHQQVGNSTHAKKCEKQFGRGFNKNFGDGNYLFLLTEEDVIILPYFG